MLAHSFILPPLLGGIVWDGGALLQASPPMKFGNVSVRQVPSSICSSELPFEL